MSADAILATLDAKRTALAEMVPTTVRASLTYESVRTGVALAMERSPRLAECSPRSVYAAVSTLVRLGLDVSGYTQEAHLVPFRAKRGSDWVMECIPMIGQAGKIKLAYQSGHVDRIISETIHEHDDWAMDLASGSLRHAIDLRERDRGEMLAAYCRIWLRGRPDPILEMMPIAEFEKIEKAASKRNKGKLSPAYRDWRSEMARRSVISRALKRVPRSPDIAELLSRESRLAERQERGEVIDATWDDPAPPRAISEDLGDPTAATRQREPVPVEAEEVPRAAARTPAQDGGPPPGEPPTGEAYGEDLP